MTFSIFDLLFQSAVEAKLQSLSFPSLVKERPIHASLEKLYSSIGGDLSERNYTRCSNIDKVLQTASYA